MSDHAHPVAALPKGEQRSILLHGLLAFAFTGSLAVVAAFRTPPSGYAPSDAVAVPYFLGVFLLATALLLLGLHALRRAYLFEALLTLTMLTGGWFLADLFLPPGAALVAGGAVILLRYVWKSVVSLNLSLAVGIAGVSAALGADFSPTALVIVLTLLAFYDIVAVYATKHMVKMFRELNARGVVFAFVLPPLRLRELVRPVVGPGSSGKAMLLGTGDVAIPAMLAASAVRGGAAPAVGSLVGAMIGFALMFVLFLGQDRRRPMPALPPIALGAILGYLLATLITHA